MGRKGEEQNLPALGSDVDDEDDLAFELERERVSEEEEREGKEREERRETNLIEGEGLSRLEGSLFRCERGSAYGGAYTYDGETYREGVESRHGERERCG